MEGGEEGIVIVCPTQFSLITSDTHFCSLTLDGWKLTHFAFILKPQRVLSRSMACVCDQLRTHLLVVFLGMCHPPHVHPTSRYVIAHYQSYQAFPTLVLQATNAGARRPGYEATVMIQMASLIPRYSSTWEQT